HVPQPSLALFFFQYYAYPRDLPSFPTRRSSDLPPTAPAKRSSSMQPTFTPAWTISPRIRTCHGLFYDGDIVHAGVNVGCIDNDRSEEHTSELQSLTNLVCRLLLEKKNTK